jgi:hypothetical protein
LDFEITPIELSKPESSPKTTSEMRRGFGEIGIFNFGWRKIILAVFVFLIVAAAIILLNKESFSESNVEFTLDGAKEITAGDLVSYKISLKNKSEKSIAEIKLSFFYPPDAIAMRDGNVLDTVSEFIEIGQLLPGDQIDKEISAIIIGDRGNIKTAKAIITYRPEGLSSTLKKEANSAATITTLAVPLTVVAPPTILANQETTYLIDYRNQSDQDFSNLKIVAKFPEGFSAPSYSLQPIAGQTAWLIENLKKGEGGRITIRGKLSGAERENKTLIVTLQKKILTPDGERYIDFERAETSSVISSPLLSLNVLLNDSASYTSRLDDTLRYKINFKNNSEYDLANLVLSATLEGVMFDYSTVNSNTFFDSQTNSLSWNVSTVPALGLLRPGQSGSTEFSVKIKNYFSGGSGVNNTLVKAKLKLETYSVPAELDLEKISTTNELTTRISSAPTFGQKITLSDPYFGRNGPFPPKVGQKTNLTVGWIVTNPSGELTQVKVSGVLMPGVVWESLARMANSLPNLPQYDTRTNTVTWDIGSVPPGVGVSSPKYEANFQISIIPSVNQVGQAPALLRDVKFEAVDAFTKEKISRTIQNSTTYDVSDSTESGIVQN